MNLFAKLRAYGRVLRGGRRNRSDLSRRLLRRPQILLGVTAYELALLGSSAVDGGIKSLASIKAASRVGCLF
jgi:hypothetical protein